MRSALLCRKFSQNPKEKLVQTRMQKTLDEMTDSAVLAMALDEMECLGLVQWKSDADKKPTIDENSKAQGLASSGLVLTERDSRASFAERRSLADQVKQLLEQANAASVSNG